MTTSGMQAPAPEPPEPLDVVETPTSPSSGLARSRFEFETDKRNEGTKILMVEWEAPAPEEEAGPEKKGAETSDWEASWEGKGPVLPVRDVDPEAGNNIRRVYFLLPPGAPVPALVSITRKGGNGEDGAGTTLRTKPMPAIFPAELTSKHDAGRRGVLHTIWAKRRLAELQAEIVAEMKANGESVGLEMAMQEQQWIVDHFGLAPDPGIPQPTKLHIPQSSAGPASPRSPIGGKLGEKLRGLKLATSPAELAAASQGECAHPHLCLYPPPVSGWGDVGWKRDQERERQRKLVTNSANSRKEPAAATNAAFDHIPLSAGYGSLGLARLKRRRRRFSGCYRRQWGSLCRRRQNWWRR
jgi:hypothetical protein